jgi:hypothetical protein
MGHKDIQTTLVYYAHATKSKKLLATGAIIRFLGQGEDNQLELSISATRKVFPVATANNLMHLH